MKRYSILYQLDRCYVCGTTKGIHIHEVFYGTANRKKSIEHGFCVGLCGYHHNLSSEGVHFNKRLDLQLKKAYEIAYLRDHTVDEFIALIGKNYLEEGEI